MATSRLVFRDQFWKDYFEEFVNNAEYWHQPKGFAIRRETLPVIYRRLRILAGYAGKPWREVQDEYTDALIKKGLIELRKAKRHYTASDYSAISRMNKVVFSTLGLAWVDAKSEVFITRAGEKFLNSRGKAEIIGDQILKYQLSNPSFSKGRKIKVFPHMFLLDLLLNFPGDSNERGITKNEFILFVSRAQDTEDLGKVIERIRRYRQLAGEEKDWLWASLGNVPIISGGRVRAHPRRRSILHTIELDSSYILDFLCFPHYVCCEGRGPKARIGVPARYWQKVHGLVRKYHREYCYTEFGSEKDWFSHYGDPARKATLEDALDYYETTSKLPQALRVYSDALSKGMLKERKPLNLEEYASLRFREKMLEDFLELNLEQLEKGLKLIRRQYPTLIGPIDILAIDSDKHYVVIELKKGKASDKVMGQLHRYMGYIEEEISKGKYVRGTIVSREIDRKLVYAFKASKNPHLQLFEFRFIGHAEEVK